MAAGAFTLFSKNKDDLRINDLTGAVIDDLARWYGLISPMVESAASRTDGTLSQTVVTVGGTTTVTRV